MHYFKNKKGRSRPPRPFEVIRQKFTLGLLRLTPKKCRHIQILSWTSLAHFTNVLLNLVHNIRRLSLRRGRAGRCRRRNWHFSPLLPCFGKERWTLLRVLLPRVLESCCDHRDLHSVFHGVVHDRAENNIRVFVSSLLNYR